MKTLICNEMMQGTQSFQMMVFIIKRSKIVLNLDSIPCFQIAKYIIMV